MTKKQKRRKGHNGGRQHEVATPALEARARAALEAERWRDAITAYKELLKREQRPDWRAELAQAYAGRAEELVAKGMLKEALAIWENRAGLDPDAPMPPGHAALLMRLGQPDAVVGLLDGDAAGRLPPPQRDAIRAQLAARVLGGDRALLDRLPQDEPVRRHAEAALTAFTAYCAHDDEALRAALAAIPFRSPYRDWVQILKALLQRASAPGETEALLARIDDASAFAPVKRAAMLSLVPESQLSSAVEAAGPNAARLALALRGWPPARIALWEELRRLGRDPQPKALVRFLFQHQRALGADWVWRRSLSLAAQVGGGGIDSLREAGGRRPTRFERALFTAWTTEQQRDPWLMLERWQFCADLLQQRWRETKDADLPLRIALLLRRADAEGQILDAPARPSGDPDYFDTIAAAQLESSLDWDPDDRTTYLRLIHYYRRGRQLKDARRVLEQAQARWPQDMAFLEAAMDISLDAGSFKKAASMARRILDIDPINSGVRKRLVDAHLAHARKQVAKSRTDLARKELAAASEWARAEEMRERIALTTSLLAVIDDDRSGIDALRAHVEPQGLRVAPRLDLLLAADALGLRPGKVNSCLGLKKPKVRDHDDLIAAMTRLRAALEEDLTLSRETREMLEATLPKAPWGPLSRVELETACDTLERHGLDKTRQQVAKAALKRWPGAPIFELHRFAAKYPRGFDYRAMQDLSSLEAALERAREDGDMRTAMRIEDALPAIGPFGGPRFGPGGGRGGFPQGPLFFEEDADEDEGVPAHIIQLIRIIGTKKVLEIFGAPPELIRQVQEIERELGAEAATDLLLDFLEGGSDGDPFAGLPFPQPPRRGGRKTRRRDQGPQDDDDDQPSQLDLF